MFNGPANRVTCAARGHTLNGLALGEVVVLVLGKEAGFVSPDDALQEPTRNLHNQALLSEHERESGQRCAR